MVKIYTSQFRYSGDDRLDITVKTGDKTFAPTWEMVQQHKCGIINDDEYFERYKRLMAQSYKRNRERWNKILNKERVTLVCYCAHGQFCHRKLLAHLLTKLGAEYMGEVDSKGNFIKGSGVFEN